MGVKVTATRTIPLWVALFFAAFYICFFSPVLFSGRVLAPPADGVLFYYPHYNSSVRLWDPLLMTGYPAIADPQLMSWYPPALILRYIPESWNVFVVLGYVLASWFMFLFVRQVTGQDFAGFMSGLLFGLCGFMSAHLGHVTMIQTAVWIPAMLLCLERLANGAARLLWIGLGAFATGTCILAGHPQIGLYALVLVAGYAFTRCFSAAMPPWKYLAASGIALAGGLALSAIQILPAVETAGISTRAKLSFADFSQYALPPSQLATLLFPFLYGGPGPALLSGIPYFGASSLTELAGYAGFTGLVLTGIALVSCRSGKIWFWFACATFSVVAAMGAATPLGRIVYALPAFGQFRAQARFLLLFAVAIAVLAGYGVASIMEKKSPIRNSWAVAGAGLGLILYTSRIYFFNARPLTKAALAAGARHFAASPFHNWWIGGPLLIGCCACGLLFLFIRRPGSFLIRAALVFIAATELVGFSWYMEWHFEAPLRQVFNEPAIERQIDSGSGGSSARRVPVRGDLGSPLETPGDLPILWKVPSLGKYGPLLPSRYKELLQMEANSRFSGQWWDPRNRALDVTGGRFFAIPAMRNATTVESGKGSFSIADLTLSVGNECGADTQSTIIPVRPQEIRGIALVTLTGCSSGIGQGVPIAEVLLQTRDGAPIALQIREGVDTSEWAASCADVAPVLRHGVADVFARHTVVRGDGTCQAQTYDTTLRLPKPATVTGLEIRWLGTGVGMLKINKITLLNARDGSSEPLSEQDVRFGDPKRWRLFGKAAGVDVYENLRAQPRVWLVPKTLRSQTAEIVRTIHTSLLPNGDGYDPAAVALVEEPLAFRAPAFDPEAHASIVGDSGASVAIQTSSRQPSFLVMGDFYYPGWRATVNKRPVHIFQTNYIQRGVLLPAGRNEVLFEFRPGQFYIGAAITLSVLALFLGAMFLESRHEGRGPGNPL